MSASATVVIDIIIAIARPTVGITIIATAVVGAGRTHTGLEPVGES
jgi:hypothetical protein